MVYGFTNELVPLPQLSELCPDQSYQGLNISKNVCDAVLDVLHGEMHTGDVLLTSTLLNISSVGLYNYGAPMPVIREFLKQGIRVISILEKFDSDDYDKDTFIKIGDLIGKIQMESRRLITKKQKEGIAKAQATGRYIDRSYKPGDFPEFDSLYQLYQDNRISKSEMAKRLSISRPTLDKLFLMRKENK